MSVSYTHLELMYTDSNVENFVTYYYKIAAKNAVGAGHDSQAIAGLPNNSNPLNLQYGKDAAQFNMAVSYTHLDVYKRQLKLR